MADKESAAREHGVLATIFAAVDSPIPERLRSWPGRVAAWSEEYTERSGSSEVVEIVLGTVVFLFDLVAERVVLAYAVSTPPLHRRDSGRMRGFPDVNVGVRKLMGADAKPYDRGHFLGHASGGQLDMNLFPHLRALNRGWSSEGKAFRRLERLAAGCPGSFFFHRPEYADDTWIPTRLEYGVLLPEAEWARETFANR